MVGMEPSPVAAPGCERTALMTRGLLKLERGCPSAVQESGLHAGPSRFGAPCCSLTSPVGPQVLGQKPGPPGRCCGGNACPEPAPGALQPSALPLHTLCHCPPPRLSLPKRLALKPQLPGPGGTWTPSWPGLAPQGCGAGAGRGAQPRLAPQLVRSLFQEAEPWAGGGPRPPTLTARFQKALGDLLAQLGR